MSIDLCQVPARPAPEGTTSNFENPTTLVAASMSLIGIIVAIATILTGTRLHTNFRKLALADCQFGPLGPDFHPNSCLWKLLQ